MSAISDQLLVVAIMLYLAAMVFHAAEFAFGGRGAVARAAGGAGARTGDGAGATAPDRTLAGDGGTGGAATATATAVAVADQPPPATGSPAAAGGRAMWAGRAAAFTMLAAVLAHLGCLVARGVEAGRPPWGNLYEFVIAVTFVGAVAWLVVQARRPDLRHLGLFVALAEVLLLGLDGMVFYTRISPLMPALHSYWLLIHVTAAMVSSGIFLVGMLSAVMYLVRAGWDSGKRGLWYNAGRWLPVAPSLERLTFRLHAFAFPIWTFAVAAGAIWAEAAWGRYWGWDPKETWAFISWMVYAGYLHARATSSVRRSTATWIAVLGWVTMMVNLIGVNLFVSSFHSYAGVN